MKVLILAAGRGERLKPLTDHTPKPLTIVHGKALLAHHFIRLKQANYNQLVINVSWLKQQIIEFSKHHAPQTMTVKISDEGERPLETGGGMLKALPLLDNTSFLAVNADVFTDFDFSNLSPLKPNYLAHLVLVKNPEHNSSGDFCLDSSILQLKHADKPSYTYSGIGIFHPSLFKDMPLGKAFSVTPLIKKAIAQSKVSAQLYEGAWSDVGTIERLNELNAEGC